MSTNNWILTTALFGVHFFHLLFMQHLYPYQIYDSDLLSYFVYYQNLTHDQQGLLSYMIPKPLAVFLLGPLDSPQTAFYCTLVIASLLGCLVFLVGTRFLGPLCRVLLSLFFLLDPHRNLLALRSGADLYLRFRDHSFIPFEQAMEFTNKAFNTILKKEWQEGDSLLTALAFLPYYTWRLKADPQRDRIYTSEDAFIKRQHIPQQPSWVAYTPRIYTDKKAVEGTQRLLNHGYILRLENNHGALYQWQGRG